MYIKRKIQSKFLESLTKYPIITLMGPRQSGKTTFVRHELGQYHYVNLEDPTKRALISADIHGFFDQHKNGLILDEIQRMPELLSYLQVIVDENPTQTGMFILTGSHQLELHQAISQSLAGRTALLTLLPFSISELNGHIAINSLDDLLLNGFYPRIYQHQLDPTEAYRYYFQTYIERDIRQLIYLRDLSTFQKFIKLCAGRIGQVINFNSLSNEVGVSTTTVRHWLSLLEASYIVIRLTPYFENFGKRIIKSPKLYFTDVGLAAFLLDIETTAQLARDPLRGNLFENLVILDIFKQYYNQGKNAPLYYFRDQHGNEVDLLIKKGNEFIGIEVKSSTTFNPVFTKGLNYFQSLVGDRYQKGYVIYGGVQEQAIQNNQLISYKHTQMIMGS